MSNVPNPPELTNEESAFFVRSFWTALLSPTWPRQLLIELGHLVHSKIPLSKFNEQQLAALLPKLREMAVSFGSAINRQIGRVIGSPEKEEVANHIRILWAGITSPNWTSDDLIELGKAVFTRTTLAAMSDKQLAVLLPYLSQIADKVGSAILKSPAQPTSAPVPPAEEVAAPTDTVPTPNTPKTNEENHG